MEQEQILNTISAVVSIAIVVAVILYLAWLIRDSVRFSKNLKKGSAKFEMDLKKMTQAFMQNERDKFSQAKAEIDEKIDKAIEEANGRIDVLGRENMKLREQNEAYREKLKNLGFSDIDLDA